MWLNGFWLTDYWLDGFWQAPTNRIRYGDNIRFGVGWKLGSTPDSNPGEYNPYTRQLPDASSPLFATEPLFGGGHFGLGQFGVGEFGWAPTFTDDVPYTPIYT